MDNHKGKRLIKNTLLFSVGNAGSKLLMLIIVPLYTYYVSVKQMGQYDMANTYVSLVAPLACLAIYESVYRWLLDNTNNSRKVIFNGLILTIGAVLLFDVLALGILHWLDYPFTLEFILLVDSMCLYSFAQFTTRGLRHNRLYAVQGILYSVVLIIANLVLVIWMRWEARGLLWSMIAANFSTAMLLFGSQRLYVLHIRQKLLDIALIKDFVRYSLPIVPNNIAWWLVNASNRLIINWKLGDAANGIFAISMKFPSIVTMLSTFFYQAWQEQAISEYNSKERDKYYSKVFNNYAKILLSGVLALLPATKAVILIMEESYADASRYVGFLYLAAVFNAFAAFYGTGYLSTKKTSGAFSTTAYGAIVNVICSFVLIPYGGLYAAAIGNMLGYLVIWISRIIQTKKYFNIRVNWNVFLLLVMLNVGTIIAIQFVNLWGIVLVECIVCLIAIALNREWIGRLIGTLLRNRQPK